jgi:hypothetical protein
VSESPGAPAPGPPPGGWTPRAAARRARAVLQEESLRSLGMRVLGETVYRRMLVMEGLVTEPPRRVEAKKDVDFAPLEPVEIEDYLSLRPDQSRSEIESRFAAGHFCFATRERDRLVQSCWFAPRHARVEYLDWELPLPPGFAYVYDFYAAASARGGHLFRAQVSEMYSFFSDRENVGRWFANPDVHGFFAAFHLENRIWLLFARAGLRPREVVGYVGVGRLRYRFRRPAPSEARLRRAARRNAARQRRRKRAGSEPTAADSGPAGAEMPSRP